MKNCGNSDHSEYCLCDVPTLGIKMDPVAVQHMWMGDRVAEIRDYDLTHKWDVVEWLADLVTLKDAQRANYLPTMHEIPALEKRQNPLEWWRDIRETVGKIARHYPIDTIMVALNQLQVDIDEFMPAMSTGKVARHLTAQEFADFEKEMLERKPNYAAVGRKYGLGRSTILSFKKLFEPMHLRKYGVGGDMKLVRREFHELIKNVMGANETLALIEQKYGVKYSKFAYYDYKKNHGIQ